MKFNLYSNTKRSESKMINNFKKKFGSPKEVVVGFGDWEQKNQIKYQEPTKGKGMRTLLKKAGYPLYLVDEYRTSCRCSDCQENNGHCEKFRLCKNPRPWRRKIEPQVLRHGLLKCNTCSKLWNRDLNSSLNIHRIVKDTINGKGRPNYLSRPNTASV